MDCSSSRQLLGASCGRGARCCTAVPGISSKRSARPASTWANSPAGTYRSTIVPLNVSWLTFGPGHPLGRRTRISRESRQQVHIEPGRLEKRSLATGLSYLTVVRALQLRSAPRKLNASFIGRRASGLVRPPSPPAGTFVARTSGIAAECGRTDPILRREKDATHPAMISISRHIPFPRGGGIALRAPWLEVRVPGPSGAMHAVSAPS